MTVALSHSRFKAVINPICNRISLTSTKDRIKYLFEYTITILVISVALTIPCLWEYDIKFNDNSAVLRPSSYRLSPYYTVFYVGVLSLGILGIAPFGLLVYFTAKISKAISQSSIDVSNPSPSQQQEIYIFNQGQRRTLVIKLISVFFLGFHALRLGLTFAELVIQVNMLNNKSTIYDIECDVQFWLNLLSPISGLLLVINSSINVIIYMKVNKYFSFKINLCQSTYHYFSNHQSLIQNSDLQMTSLRSRGYSNSMIMVTLPQRNPQPCHPRNILVSDPRSGETKTTNETVNVNLAEQNLEDATFNITKQGDVYL